MTVAAFFGYLFLSCGPPLAAGLPFFYHRSFLSLTTITSMFAWLAVLMFISCLFRAFVPLPDTAVGYIPLVLVSTLVEEGARLGLWVMHKKAGVMLKQLADTASVQYTSLDEIALAYSVGWGHGFTHMMFQFGPFLPLTWHEATDYNSLCPSISLFLSSVLLQLGIFAMLAGGHVVFIYGMSYSNKWLAVLPAAMHVTAACVTLQNFAQDGCYVSIPVVMCMGMLMAIVATYVTWRVATRQVRR